MRDPNRLSAYLVTSDDPSAIAMARWFWGSAQQVNLTVSGVLAPNLIPASPDLQAFAPLPIYPLPSLHPPDWDNLLPALPDFSSTPAVPKPLAIDIAARQISVFLPGFTKKQVKLTQLGAELTVEAGDQRRNIPVPPELQGLSIQSGKFEEPYLVISY